MEELGQQKHFLKDYNQLQVQTWKPFIRQLLVCSGVWTCYFMLGLCAGAPTVFIPQFRRDANSTEVVTAEMASWLSSAVFYASTPWVVILPILTRFTGRKITQIVFCVISLIGFVIFYLSKTITLFLVSEIIQGVLAASQTTVSIMIISEYTSPRYRGVFLTLKSATLSWGIWVSNAIGTFSHWTNIGLLGIICSVYILTSVVMWPESPYWLANRGDFRKCSASHRWLKGTNKEAEKELADLIKSTKEFLQNDVKLSAVDECVQNLKQVFNEKRFYKPILLSILVLTLYHFSGKMVCTVYAIDIIKKITNNESTAYQGMLVLDGITVFGMYFGSALSKFLKRRTLLLVSSTIGILMLFIIALYLYLIELSILTENKYISVLLLTIFSLAISCGPIIMTTSIIGEILPLNCRSTSVMVISLFANMLMASVLKLSPYLFSSIKMHGTFLFYGLCSSICIILVYKYLPETKDMTLQAISDCMRGNTSNVEKESVSLHSNSNKNNTKELI